MPTATTTTYTVPEEQAHNYYLRKLGKYASSGEITAATIQRAQAGDSDAQLAIIGALIPLIYSRIKKWTSAETRAMYSEDMVSSAVCGILIAVDKYDIIRGANTPFSLYAKLKIDRELINFLSEMDAVCKLPRETIEAYRRSLAEEDRATQEQMTGRKATPEPYSLSGNGLRLSPAAVRYISELSSRISYEVLLEQSHEGDIASELEY